MSIRNWLETGEGPMFLEVRPAAVFAGRSDRTLPSQSVPLYNIEGTAGLVPLFLDKRSLAPVDYIHIPNLPRCDGAIYVVGDSMYPLLKSGDIVLYKQIGDVNDIFWGDMYLLSIDHRRRGVRDRQIYPKIRETRLRQTRQPESPSCG